LAKGPDHGLRKPKRAGDGRREEPGQSAAVREIRLKIEILRNVRGRCKSGGNRGLLARLMWTPDPRRSHGPTRQGQHPGGHFRRTIVKPPVPSGAVAATKRGPGPTTMGSVGDCENETRGNFAMQVATRTKDAAGNFVKATVVANGSVNLTSIGDIYISVETTTGQSLPSPRPWRIVPPQGQCQGDQIGLPVTRRE
jgi:hypothetical protein